MDGYVLPGTFRFLSLLMVRFFLVVTLDVLEGDMFQDHVGGEFEVVTLNTANPLLSLPLPPVAYLFPTHLRVGWGGYSIGRDCGDRSPKTTRMQSGKA